MDGAAGSAARRRRRGRGRSVGSVGAGENRAFSDHVKQRTTPCLRSLTPVVRQQSQRLHEQLDAAGETLADEASRDFEGSASTPHTVACECAGRTPRFRDPVSWQCLSVEQVVQETAPPVVAVVGLATPVVAVVSIRRGGGRVGMRRRLAVGRRRVPVGGRRGRVARLV